MADLGAAVRVHGEHMAFTNVVAELRITFG